MARFVVALLAASQLVQVRAADAVPSQAAGPSALVLLATAVDTGCVILRAATELLRACVGDRLTDQPLVLIAVDHEAAVFRVETAPRGPLDVRVAIGATLDASGASDRLQQAVGPRPGWIQSEDSSIPPSREDAP